MKINDQHVVLNMSEVWSGHIEFRTDPGLGSQESNHAGTHVNLSNFQGNIPGCV